MQLLRRYPSTDERYVTERAWESATLPACPFHPAGGCGLQKLGSYPRVEPAGVRVPRWWCPTQGESISLLPSFLAARLSGTLAAVEQVVAAVEVAGSVEAAVEAVNPLQVEAPVGHVCAVRWIRRRVRAVRAALVAIATLLPAWFAGVPPTLAGLRGALARDGDVLVALREIAERHLGALPAPLGFATRGSG